MRNFVMAYCGSKYPRISNMINSNMIQDNENVMEKAKITIF